MRCRLAIVVCGLLGAGVWSCGSGSGSVTHLDGPGGSSGTGGSSSTGGSSGTGGQGGTTSDGSPRDAPIANDAPPPADARDAPPPNDLRAERPTEGSPCRAQNDCTGSTFPIFCADPDTPRPCGIPCPFFRPCLNDAECRADAGGSVCEVSTGARGPACCVGMRVCMPACTSDQSCRVGEACDPSGHCGPKTCQRDGDCPAHFACAGTCVRRSCSGDGDCPGGFCVLQRCHAQLGTCRGPAP
jgi:hypothetical protein